jgi:hypothetical protein
MGTSEKTAWGRSFSFDLGFKYKRNFSEQLGHYCFEKQLLTKGDFCIFSNLKLKIINFLIQVYFLNTSYFVNRTSNLFCRFDFGNHKRDEYTKNANESKRELQPKRFGDVANNWRTH